MLSIHEARCNEENTDQRKFHGETVRGIQNSFVWTSGILANEFTIINDIKIPSKIKAQLVSKQLASGYSLFEALEPVSFESTDNQDEDHANGHRIQSIDESDLNVHSHGVHQR